MQDIYPYLHAFNAGCIALATFLLWRNGVRLWRLFNLMATLIADLRAMLEGRSREGK